MPTGPRLPLVSVLCPTKNRRRFIARLVEQFAGQDYGPKELLVIEDGDEDSRDLCGGPGVRYMRFDGSIGAKLNYGAEQARGEWLARFDDDDYEAHDRLTKQLAIAQITGKPVLACCSGLFWREGSDVGWEYHGDSWTAPGFGAFYRRDWALAHPYADSSLREDIAFSEAAREAGMLATVSGLDIAVCLNHDANTCTRDVGHRNIRIGELVLKSDNWREVPLERIMAVIDGR